MKYMVILLLVTASRAIDLKSQNSQDDRTEKRELPKGNSAVDKRTPAISTVSPAITPGIEYADSKESQQDKSPTHQIYATPLPPISKISDVLTGQGPAFQSAIASHLYAPISVYQPRLGSPTTYEVSAPVPSNLAYAEHRISLQPSQNTLEFTQKPLHKSKNFQQVLVQQPLAYPQTFGPIPQLYQQIPQLQYQDLPINQFPLPLYPGQQSLYQDQLVPIAPPIQPSNPYSPEPRQENHQPAQRELKLQPGSKNAEKQSAPQKLVQPQGAVSFTKFSQLQPSLALQPQQEVQYQQQPQPQIQLQSQPQIQLQSQPQYHQPQPQYQQQIQYQPQQLQYHPQQPQYQLLQQPQIQYQPLQQYQIVPQLEQTQQIQPQQYQLQTEQVQQQSQAQIQYVSQPQLPQPKQQLLQQTQQTQPKQLLLQQTQLTQPKQLLLQQTQLTQPKQLLLQQTQLTQPKQLLLQQPQHQPLSQPQPLPQQQIHLQPITKVGNVGKISYLRPGPVFLQSQPDYRSNVALPTLPPVQYFGKYAQSIFGNLQH